MVAIESMSQDLEQLCLEVRNIAQLASEKILRVYNTEFFVTSKEDTDFIDVRITVVTPIIWKILGIALIALVIAGIAVIFERLGRR